MSALTCTTPRPGLISLTGELTRDTVEQLQEVILEALQVQDTLELDLLNISKIDSAGVQLLVAARIETVCLKKSLTWFGFSMAMQETLGAVELVGALGNPNMAFWR